MDWNIAYAKSQFSELVEQAKSEPQIVCNRQKPVAVVLSFQEYKRLQNLDVLVHTAPKWSKFTDYSIRFLDDKKNSAIELPSRKDRSIDLL